MDDKQIIELYNLRDEQAIKHTESKYGRYCFSIAKNILSNEQDCEECVNDTWNRAWNAIPPKNPNNFRLFLGKIVRNLAIDKVKSESCQKRGGSEFTLALDEIGDIVSGDDTFEQNIEYEMLVKSLNVFLRSLPERERNVFINRYFYIMPIEDIAKKYSLSAQNVHKILSRTRIKLKEYLRVEGYQI